MMRLAVLSSLAKRKMKILSLFVSALLLSAPAFAQDDADLARKLANPVASLISFPIQANYDANIGPAEEGSVWRINIQPVIPFTLTENWNLISRTIIPVIDQQDIPVVGSGASGIGDIVQSFFVSPAAGGLVWGVGPVLLLPSASDEALGGEKWGIGPNILVLKQQGRLTIGALANHIFSVAGDTARADINATFFQPFVSYITPTKTTLSLSSETTRDWENEVWSVPINFVVSQLLKVGPQIIQVAVGGRYWAESPDGGPQNWGARVQLTLLFPK